MLPIAIDSDQRSSRRAMSALDPTSTIHDAPFENVTAMGDTPDKAGHQMPVGAASLHCLRSCFSLPKTTLKSL